MSAIAATRPASNGSWLMQLLEGPPMPEPPPKTWRSEVTVAPEADTRLTPAQCPVLYDLGISMRNRLSDLDAKEQRLLARLALVRRERTALQPAYASLLASVIPDSIENAAKPLPAQEGGDLGAQGKISDLLSTPA